MSKDNPKLCPICGSVPVMKQTPMWRTIGSSTHGYFGSYTYRIKCWRSECPMSGQNIERDTVYRTTDEALAELIQDWNARCDEISNLMEGKSK